MKTILEFDSSREDRDALRFAQNGEPYHWILKRIINHEDDVNQDFKDALRSGRLVDAVIILGRLHGLDLTYLINKKRN